MLKVSKLSEEKDFYVNRLESVIFSTEMFILQTKTYWKGGPMELKFQDLEMQKSNMSTDREKRVHKKNGVIRLHTFS